MDCLLCSFLFFVFQDAEFPIVCEDCLGEEIYLRMMKSPFDQACKVCCNAFCSLVSLFLIFLHFQICLRPFTTFRWRPGGKGEKSCCGRCCAIVLLNACGYCTGKFRTTEICQTCAKLRNACQSCILDLVYHLPIQIRDQINPVGPAGFCFAEFICFFVSAVSHIFIASRRISACNCVW